MRRLFPVIMVLIMFSLASACGGGGGGGGTGGPDLAAFLGIWFGPGDDGLLDPFEVELTINSSGGITGYDIDNVSVAPAIPASFVVEDASSAVITFNDFSLGGLFWDDTVEHMLFVDPVAGVVGVVEKNAAPPLPAYAISDAVGAWAGYVYAPDGLGDFDKESPVLLTVANDLSFSGTDPTNNPFTGSFNPALYDSSHGMYVGTVSGPSDQSIQVLLSPDRNFSGGVLWEQDDVFPDDYFFLVLTRQ